MPQYITIPTSLTPPADGGKVDLSSACEWHRDDSALPNTLAVANGEYLVFRLSDPTTETAEADAPTVVPYARQITATLPSYAINLNTVRALPGGVTATYTGPALPPTGVTLSGSTLTLFPTSGGGAGTYTVRSTRSDGVLEDLVLTLTTVALVVTVSGAGAVTIAQGADDPADAAMSATLEAEPGSDAEIWDGVTVNWTLGQLAQNTAFWGAAPLLEVTSGEGADGAVTVGGVVTIARPGARLYRAGGTPAAVSTTFADAGGTVAGSSPLTITSGMVGTIRAIESDGGPNTGTSNVIDIEASLPLGYVTSWENSSPTNGTQRTIASGITIPAGRYLVGVSYNVTGGGQTWSGSPISFAGVGINFLGTTADQANANAGLLELASDTTGDLVANAMTSSTTWRGITVSLVRIGTMTLGTHQRFSNARAASASAPADFATNSLGVTVTIAAGGGLVVFGGRSGTSADNPAEPFLQNSTRVYDRDTAIDQNIGPVVGFDTGLSSGSRAVGLAYVNATTQASRSTAIIAIPLIPA